MEHYFVIESVTHPGSFYAGESWDTFKGWLYTLKFRDKDILEEYLEKAIQIGPCKVVEIYEKIEAKLHR